MGEKNARFFLHPAKVSRMFTIFDGSRTYGTALTIVDSFFRRGAVRDFRTLSPAANRRASVSPEPSQFRYRIIVKTRKDIQPFFPFLAGTAQGRATSF